jgi:DNA-binding ferritin-like protein
MRPLIEILEDERTLVQKLESVYRYFDKVDDVETFDILRAQKERVERDLDMIRNELKQYIEELFVEEE